MVWQDNREAVFLRTNEDAPIDMVLMLGDDAVNLAGVSELGLVLTPQDGSEEIVYKNTDVVPCVSVQDGTKGIVRFIPNLQDLVTGMVRLLGYWYIILASRRFCFPQDGFVEFNLIRDPAGFITNQLQFRADAIIVYS